MKTEEKNLPISLGRFLEKLLEDIGRVVIKRYMGNPFVISIIINRSTLVLPSRGNIEVT
jgi:hypothetical protein